MPELPLTIAQAADWVRRGSISSVALTTALLERSQASQASLAAFNHIADAAALRAAGEADADFARGIDRGWLQGIPLAIKDNIATADMPTTASSRLLDPAWGIGAEATVARKLRQAGAVLLGKVG